MSATLTVDDREFNDAVAACLANTRREASVALNSRAIHLGKKAIEETPVADVKLMEYKLGIKGYKWKLTRGGRIIKKTKAAMMRDDSFAERIIRKRDIREGNPRKTNEEAKEAARKLIMGRKSSAGFISSGWIDAIVDLAGRIGLIRDPAKIGKKKNKRMVKKGKAIPAVSGKDFTTVEVTNTALLAESNYGSKGDPMRVAVPALQRAMDRETKEMLDHLTKKLQDSLNKNSARKA